LEQVPPIFSAIHIQGERAYAKARRGETFEMAPRCVHIHRLTLESYQPDEGVAQLIVECGKGTYMRALARDIGRVLGCGAHLEKLLRLTTLGFTLDEAITLQTLQDVVEHGALETVLLPIDRVLDDIPVLRLDMEAWHKIRNGQAVWIKAPDVAPGTVRLYGPDGCFGALGALEGVAGFPGNRHCRPQRLFFTQ
jgi:tRNA pseudouridine55 synthase